MGAVVFTNYVDYIWWVFLQVPIASVVNLCLCDKNSAVCASSGTQRVLALKCVCVCVCVYMNFAVQMRVILQQQQAYIVYVSTGS